MRRDGLEGAGTDSYHKQMRPLLSKSLHPLWTKTIKAEELCWTDTTFDIELGIVRHTGVNSVIADARTIF